MNEKDGRPDDLNELARRAAAGDAGAADELFGHPEFHKTVEMRCRSVLRPSGNVLRYLSDLKQVTYLLIFQNLGQFKGVPTRTRDGRESNPFAAWVNVIARRAFLKNLYEESHEQAGLKALACEQTETVSEAEAEQEASLMEAFSALSPEEQRILRLHLAGCNPRQITEEIHRAEWRGWDARRRKNEPERVRKRLRRIQERIASTLGLWPQSSAPRPAVEPPGDEEEDELHQSAFASSGGG